MKEVKGFFIVKNEKGLHTRPATELVKCANTFSCEIRLIYKNLVVNAKSLLGILMMAASKGTKVQIIAKGKDADKAIEALIKLASNKFNIGY
jgi:phosphocarrier protein